MDGPLASDTTTYGYDELGRVVTRTLNGVTTSWQYDALGRQTSQTDPLGAFTYTYVGTSARLQDVTYPNAQATTYAYHPNSGDKRLQEIHNKQPGGATLSRFIYSYDAFGNVKTWTQQADSNPAKAYDLGYNSADQLTSAIYRTTDPTPVVLKRYAYAYDAAGNRTTEQIDDAATQAAYDNQNRLTSQQAGGALLFKGTLSETATVTVQGKPATVTPANQFEGPAQVPSGTSTVEVKATDPSGNLRTNTYQVSQSGATKTMTYDLNGNLTGDGTRTYEWDGGDRLTAVNQGTHRSELTYDGLRRLVQIVEKESGATVKDLRFVWCELEICEERDGTGAVVTKRFSPYGVQDTTLGSFFYTRDHLGSIREAGNSRYDYDPYGRATRVSGTFEADFGYTGHYVHAPTGLVVAPYRAYETSLGRWISEDPIGLRGGLNRYAYVDGDPIGISDPLGLAGKGERGKTGKPEGTDDPFKKMALRASEWVKSL